MKQTVKTSRTAGQLEKMFRELNTHYFDGELPEPIISLKKTPGAYGHFTCGKVWQAGTEHRYEINISTATLSRPIEDTTATLLHEMVHLYCMENGIKDTSNREFIITSTSRMQQKPTVCILNSIQNMAGRSQAPQKNCSTSLLVRAGQTFRWKKNFF